MKFFFKFFVLGIFTSFLFPPFFLLPLGFVFIPLLFILISDNKFNEETVKIHFFSGFFYGMGFFLIYLGWIKEPFLIDDSTKKYFLFSYLLIIYCSLFFGLIFIILKIFKKNYLKFFMLPALIVCAEFMLGNFSYGFPWLSFSLIFSANIIGTSLVYYLGSYGLSYSVIIFFLFPTIFFYKDLKTNKLIILFFIIIIIITLLLLFNRISNKDSSTQKQFNVSLVQLNYPIKQNLNKLQIADKYNEIVKYIENIDSDLIIFGENDYPFLMNENNIKLITSNITKNKNIIIGSTSFENKQYFNSLYLFNKDTYERFDKKILVPFGEFIPMRKYFNFMEFIAGSVNFSKGTNSRIIKFNNHVNIIPVICYEILFPWKLLNKFNIQADIIINLTNDSWLGVFSGPYQHFYFAKLRAAEFNKPLIRVSNNGISAVINKYGKIKTFIKLNEKKIKHESILFTKNNKNYLYIHKIIFIIIVMSIIVAIINNKKNNE